MPIELIIIHSIYVNQVANAHAIGSECNAWNLQMTYHQFLRFSILIFQFDACKHWEQSVHVTLCLKSSVNSNGLKEI